MVWRVAIRDLQYKRRRFVVSVAAAALVFAMTLILAGLSASFDAEASRTLDDINAVGFYTTTDASGPFMGAAVFPATQAQATGAGDPLLYRTLTVTDATKQTVNAFGVTVAGVGDPQPDTGQRLTGTGNEIVADTRLGYQIGDSVSFGGGQTFTVVGLLNGSTLLGGSPNVFMRIEDLQKVGFLGAPVATSVATNKDVPPPPQMQKWGLDDAHDDMVRPLIAARDTITFVSVLLWLVAVCIIGSVAYLSAVERTGEFAVFKATGVPGRIIVAGLLCQAALTAAAASLVGELIAVLLVPRVPMPIDVTVSSMVTLPAIAVLTGGAASLAASRRALATDPALAFG